MIGRAAAAVLLVAAATCGILAMRVEPSIPASEGPSLSTAGWSPRRIPGAIGDGVAQLRLQADVDAELAGVESCLVVEGPSGRLVDRGASTALIPASTIKLLTAVGAIAALPPEFRFMTTVRATEARGRDAVERVALVGGADPLLGTPEWIAARAADPETAGTAVTPLAVLADGVAGAGIRSIPGGVIGVAARSAGEPTYLPVWPESYRTSAIGPVSSLTVNGGFRAPGQAATDPALFAAEELTRLLRDRGIAVGEPSRGDAVPDAPVLATVQSAPLNDVLAEMLAVSDNLTAEILVRELAVANGESSTSDGLAVLRDRLAALGLPTNGLTQADGSGLSRENRVPCELLVSVLALTVRPEFAPIRAGLAVAGERGTLAERLLGTTLAGHLAAKTGTLPGVSGLAGFLEVGPPLRFAFVANGEFGEVGALPLRDRVAETLARYPDAPPADVLVPAPAVPSP